MTHIHHHIYNQNDDQMVMMIGLPCTRTALTPRIASLSVSMISRGFGSANRIICGGNISGTPPTRVLTANKPQLTYLTLLNIVSDMA